MSNFLLLHMHIQFWTELNWYSFLTTICWRDCLFPILWSWHFCQRSFGYIHEGPGLSFLFHLSLCFMLYLTVLITVVLQYVLKSRNVDSFFPSFLAVSGPLRFHRTCKIFFFFSISAKGSIGMLVRICRLLWVIWTCKQY